MNLLRLQTSLHARGWLGLDQWGSRTQKSENMLDSQNRQSIQSILRLNHLIEYENLIFHRRGSCIAYDTSNKHTESHMFAFKT